MNRRLDNADAGQDGPLHRLFSVFFGAFLGLSLVKFGNPPIFEKSVTAPTNIYEFILGNPWPISWAYLLLAVVGVVGLTVAHWKVEAPNLLVVLPLVWLIWECVATAGTVSPALTKPTLEHFFACVACFYLGLFSLAHVRKLGWFWPGLVAGFLIVIVVGWEQRFGGLEQTRRYFYLYLYPRMKDVSPEYLKKLSSTRVFSTLFYPNALAGAILLMFPALLALIWGARQRFTAGARGFLLFTVGISGLCCLYWSGSKGGWLLILALGIVWLLQFPLSRQLKHTLVTLVLVAGLAAFFWRYSAFFHRGATSVGARFDYWQAAVQTAADHPWLGTGPGTFSIAYQKVKRPESEMARLAHNDYLQQASDSGLPGLLIYSGFIIWVIVGTASGFFPTEAQKPPIDGPTNKSGSQASGQPIRPKLENEAVVLEKSVSFALWLGLLGWTLQGLLEFGLYIPALAWPAFAFMGLLLGHLHRNGILRKRLSAS